MMILWSKLTQFGSLTINEKYTWWTFLLDQQLATFYMHFRSRESPFIFWCNMIRASRKVRVDLQQPGRIFIIQDGVQNGRQIEEYFQKQCFIKSKSPNDCHFHDIHLKVCPLNEFMKILYVHPLIPRWRPKWPPKYAFFCYFWHVC